MVLGRFREAVSDAAETLRRVFVDPPCHRLDPGGFALVTGGMALPAARVSEGRLLAGQAVRLEALAFLSREEELPLLARATLVEERGWARWRTGVGVLNVPPLEASGCRRTAIPALPRHAVTRAEPFRAAPPKTRAENLALSRPRSGGARPDLPTPRTREDLVGMRARPLALRGEVPEVMGAAWTMRQVLQLVRQSGENARNLELLGCFRVPAEGLLALTHDARKGCLWVQLGPEAARAPRRRLILARRKDDRMLVSCFSEDA